MKKYRLLKSKSTEKYGRTLYKIKAIRSFGDVQKGEEGGYIEKEENLSHDGTCWVYKDAIVLYESRVVRRGEVRGGVVCGGEVWGGVVWGGVVRGGEVWGGEVRGGEVWGGEVRGGEVRGGVVCGGEVWGGVFEKSTFQVQGSGHFLNISHPNHIQIGCHNHTFEYWKENFRRIGKLEGYSKEQIAEYGKYIEMAIAFPNQPKPIQLDEEEKIHNL